MDRTTLLAAGIATALAAIVSPLPPVVSGLLLVVAILLLAWSMVAALRADRQGWEFEVEQFRHHLIRFAFGLGQATAEMSGGVSQPVEWRAVAERAGWPCIPRSTSIREARSSVAGWHNEDSKQALRLAELIYPPTAHHMPQPQYFEFHGARQGMKVLCEHWGTRSAVGFRRFIDRSIEHHGWEPILYMLAYLEIALGISLKSATLPRKDGFFRLGNRLFGCYL